MLFSWPVIERRITGDQRRHDLLDRPRDRPIRSAIGAAFLSWVVIIFAGGSTDRLFYRLHISYPGQIHFWRIGVCDSDTDLLHHEERVPRPAARESHPLRAGQGQIVARRDDGQVVVIGESPDRTEPQPAEQPVDTAPGEESRR